jgi:methyl coenzyme M reductase subunit C
MYQQFPSTEQHMVEHNEVETQLNMHHILIVFSTYVKSIKPYNTRSIQNMADIDGICIFLYIAKEKGWAILYSSL